MANSADPDQLASSEANWSGSTLFARTGHAVLSKRRVKWYNQYQKNKTCNQQSHCTEKVIKQLVHWLQLQATSSKFENRKGGPFKVLTAYQAKFKCPLYSWWWGYIFLSVTTCNFTESFWTNWVLWKSEYSLSAPNFLCYVFRNTLDIFRHFDYPCWYSIINNLSIIGQSIYNN